MAALRIGSCSWNYPSWAGIVYSSQDPADFLSEYARSFDYVEIDRWFWSLGKRGVGLPKRSDADAYSGSTPADFRFSIKCPDSLTLTHHRARAGGAAEPNPSFLDPGLFARFLEALGGLVAKTSLFIFQFEYLNKDKMPSKEAFMDRLGAFVSKLPSGLPYAVELRNPRWIGAAFPRELASLGVAPALLQGYWMDDVAELLSQGPAAFPGDALCLRLHGRDREGMESRAGEDWSRVVRAMDEELARLAAPLRELLSAGKRVYVNVNNHYEGCAPITIAKLRALLSPGDAHA
jgi:uncharacterized protein YecE (DUF72 family)